jgi:tetratricopeptide (TPR) repeat protein
MMGDRLSPKQSAVWGIVFWLISFFALAVTLGWCYFLGAGSLERSSLAFTVCSASFATGGVLGFLFTIFGDEQEPFGKIRDAMIALASGITGIGIAKAKDFAEVLGGIHIFNSTSPGASPFSVLLVITYFVAGFFFMYFLRKLHLNPALAEAGDAIDRLEMSGQVSVVATRMTGRLSQSFLLGREIIEDIDELDHEEADRLRKDLFAEDVTQFLSACEEDVRGFLQMQPENVAMAARLHYYRVYFEKENTDARNLEEERALDWIYRALMRDPTNPDFQIKLADLLGMQGRYAEAVAIIERLEREATSPQYIQQWLGYFLLFIRGRESDAIKHSMSFHQRFPDESSALYNASCGFAQLYEIELREKGLKEISDSENRHTSLRLLREAISEEPELAARAKKHSEPSSSFESLASDPDFVKLTIASVAKSGRES